MRWNTFGPLLLATVLALTGAALPTAAQDIAATVNGETITKAQLTSALYARTGKLVLGQLVDELLVRQEAKKRNTTITKEEVDARIKDLQASSKQQTGLEWPDWLKAQDVTEADLRQKMEADLTVEKIVAPEVQVTDEEVRKYYDDNAASFKQPAQAHVLIIAVDTETQARDLLQQAQGGADFAALAKEHSEEPTSKNAGGDIGWINRGPLFEAAMKMEPGQVHGPVADEVPMGGQPKTFFFVVKLIEKKPEYTPTFDEAKVGIRQGIFDARMRVKVRDWILNVRQAAKIEVKVDFAAP